MVETIQWIDGAAVMIDQTRLPRDEVFVTCRSYNEVAGAIRSMVIRGAPAIGVAAAMGVALGVLRSEDGFEQICNTLAATRPTAVNLFWAIDRMKRVYESLRGRPVEEIRARLVAEAKLAKERLEAAAKQVQERLKEDNNLRGELQAQIDENQRLQDQINAGMNTPKHSEQAPPQSDAQKAAEAAVDPLVQWGQNVQQ